MKVVTEEAVRLSDGKLFHTVGLVTVISRLRVKLAKCPNHYTTKPPGRGYSKDYDININIQVNKEMAINTLCVCVCLSLQSRALIAASVMNIQPYSLSAGEQSLSFFLV